MSANGRPATYRQVSAQQASEQFRAAGLPGWFVEVLGELFAAFGTGAVGLKTSTFRDLTGRDPISLREFAAGRQRAAA